MNVIQPPYVSFRAITTRNGNDNTNTDQTTVYEAMIQRWYNECICRDVEVQNKGIHVANTKKGGDRYVVCRESYEKVVFTSGERIQKISESKDH